VQWQAGNGLRDAWSKLFVQVRKSGLPKIFSLKTLAYNEKLILLEWNNMWHVFLVIILPLLWLTFWSAYSDTSLEGVLTAALHLLVDQVVILQMRLRHDGGQMRNRCANYGEFRKQTSLVFSWCVTCSADLNGGASDSSAWEGVYGTRIPHCAMKTCFFFWLRLMVLDTWLMIPCVHACLLQYYILSDCQDQLKNKCNVGQCLSQCHGTWPGNCYRHDWRLRPV